MATRAHASSHIARTALCSVLALGVSSCVPSKSLNEADATQQPAIKKIFPDGSVITIDYGRRGGGPLPTALERTNDTSAPRLIKSVPPGVVAIDGDKPPDSPESDTRTVSTSADAELLEDDTTIYSAADLEVQPPALLSRGFLGPLVDGVAVRSSLIELIISKTGSVERVKLLSRSQNMRDATFLSRAKQFNFSPATKNGVPVDYRSVIVVEDSAP